MYGTKVGNGGHGVEVYTVEDGKYAEIEVTYNGEQINKWEDLRDLCLTPQQKLQYDNGPDELKEQVDNYFKDLHGQLVTAEVDRLNKGFEADNRPQCQKFDTVDDMINNMDKIITDEFVQFCDKVAARRYSMGYRTIRTMAAALQKSRYSQQHATYVPEKKFDREMQTVVDLDVDYHGGSRYTGSTDRQEFLRRCVETGKKIRLWRGVQSWGWNSGKRPIDIKKEYFQDPQNEQDTLLGDCSGMFGSCIYVTSSEDYSGGYDDGLILNGYIDTSKAKVYVIERGNDSDGGDDPLSAEMERKIPVIVPRFRSILASKGVDSKKIDKLCDDLEDGIRRDFGFKCMLMGYDAFVAHGHQVDILNPKVWNVEE